MTAAVAEQPTTAIAVPDGNGTAPRTPAIQTGARGIQFGTFEDMYRFAKCVVGTEFCPKHIRTPEAAAVAIQAGAEVGLPPMAALQGIAVINGRPSLYGDTFLAVAMASPLFDHGRFREGWEGQGETLTAFCECARKGGQVVRWTFSVANAKSANLWSKAGPWKEYPTRMLQMRARGFAIRDAFPDTLKGFVSFEEARDSAPTITVEAVPGTVPVLPTPASRTDALAQRLAPKAPVAPEPVEQPIDPPAVDDVPTTISRDLAQTIRDDLLALKADDAKRIRANYGITDTAKVDELTPEQAENLRIEIADARGRSKTAKGGAANG